MDNRIAAEAQRQGLRGSLVRMPGRLVVGAWVVLFLASFGVAALVDWAEYQNTVVGRAQRRAEQLERWERRTAPLASYTPDWRRLLAEQDPYALAVESAFGAKGNPSLAALARAFAEDPIERGVALKTVREHFEREAQARRQIFLGALGAGFAWLLAFVFVTAGTGRWMTTRGGWVRVQSWHGGKLLMLYVPFTAATLLYAAAAAAPSNDDGSTIVLFVTIALLLLACAAMLVRATWNWLTGREGKRRVESTPGNYVSLRSRFVTPLLQLMRRPRAAAAMWLILGLLIGAIAATFALRPRTYADCILRGMKYTPTATATRALQQACGQKFGSVSQQTSGAVFSRRAPRTPRAAEAPRAPQAPRPPRAPRAPRR